MVPVNPQEHIVRYISPNTVINGRPTPYSYELRTHLDEKDVSFVHVEYYGNYNINKTYVDLRTQNNFIKNKKSGLLAEHLVDKILNINDTCNFKVFLTSYDHVSVFPEPLSLFHAQLLFETYDEIYSVKELR